MAEGVKRLSDLQERLYAQDRWAVLLIFQAMDAAGKDSVIEHVMKGVNPQGCDVYSFKQPSQEDLTMTSCGVARVAFPNAGGSGFSTAHTTKKC